MDLMFSTHALTDDEIAELDYLFNGTVCDVQPHLAKKGSVADSDLQSEGDYPKVDSEQGSQKSSKVDRDDLEMIDIDSLFDEDTDDRPVLSEEEAWKLFA